MTTCKHCKEEIPEGEDVARCKTCKRDLVDQCMECHDEIAHGLVVNQNIHVCGNGVQFYDEYEGEFY